MSRVLECKACDFVLSLTKTRDQDILGTLSVNRRKIRRVITDVHTPRSSDIFETVLLTHKQNYKGSSTCQKEFLFLKVCSVALICLCTFLTQNQFLLTANKDIIASQWLGYNSRNLSIRDFSCDTQDFLYGRVKAAIFSHWSRAKGKGKREAWP